MSNPGLHADTADERRRLLLLFLPLVALYAPFLGGGFLTDDFAHRERLLHMRTLADLVTAPDVFGFYRPLTQISLWIDAGLFGAAGAGYRSVNLALHAAVLAAAYLVARLVIGSAVGASLATLAYALTPKAHPIAVLWISARAELLMSLFVLVAVAAWMCWQYSGRREWVGLLVAAYLAAVLCKETAILLPIVLLALPVRTTAWGPRLGVAALLSAVAVIVLMWRAQVGARMPTSADALYLPSMPVGRLLHNLQNYAGRMAPGPLAVVLAVGLGAAAAGGLPRLIATLPRALAAQFGVAIVGVVWAVTLLAPALPFVARSELYVYLPVFGLCLLAGSTAASLLEQPARQSMTWGALGVCIAVLALYQGGRAREMHRDARFSRQFVAAIEHSADIAASAGPIEIVPGDATTARFLQDAIGGYLPVVLRLAFPGRLIDGSIGPHAGRAPALTLTCAYRDGAVTLSR